MKKQEPLQVSKPVLFEFSGYLGTFVEPGANPAKAPLVILAKPVSLAEGPTIEEELRTQLAERRQRWHADNPLAIAVAQRRGQCEQIQTDLVGVQLRRQSAEAAVKLALTNGDDPTEAEHELAEAVGEEAVLRNRLTVVEPLHRQAVSDLDRAFAKESDAFVSERRRELEAEAAKLRAELSDAIGRTLGALCRAEEGTRILSTLNDLDRLKRGAAPAPELPWKLPFAPSPQDSTPAPSTPSPAGKRKVSADSISMADAGLRA